MTVANTALVEVEFWVGPDKQFLGRVTLWVGILSHLRVLRAAGVKGIGKIQKYQVLGLALPPVPSVPGTEGH